MHFGFSYVGLIYLVMLFTPNILWSKRQPADYAEHANNENKCLQVIERIGEVLVSALCLIFSDFNVRADSFWSLFLLGSFLFMILYEIYWVRYFLSPRTMRDMYSSLLGIPVAGATLPVLAFFFLAIYGKNPILGAAVLFLAVGHIGIHVAHRKEL